MSQEKVDKRKQSKGEALHFAHKKVVMLSWIIVLLVVVAVALSITLINLDMEMDTITDMMPDMRQASTTDILKDIQQHHLSLTATIPQHRRQQRLQSLNQHQLVKKNLNNRLTFKED